MPFLFRGRLASAAEFRRWLLSLVLVLPVLIPYAAHLLIAPGPTEATWFIHPEMPYYMANAREHFDSGFHATYGNPYSPHYGTSRIYTQPHLFILGVIRHALNADPGPVFAVWGFVWALVAVRVIVAVYEHAVGLSRWPERMGLVAFVWGGGLLAVSGVLTHLASTGSFEFNQITRFDPAGGWWFLNLGRNLVFPTEAYYHALFLGSIWALLTRRFQIVVVLAFISSWSHPFTGLELLLVLIAWSLFELYFIGSNDCPPRLLSVLLILLVVHIGYYLVFLPLAPEHRELQRQWTIAATLDATTFVPAYALVGGLAVWSLRRLAVARMELATPDRRFYLIWFVVAFALANHEFATSHPVQPIHFDRGYVWTPLFLLGSRSLVALFSDLPRRFGTVAGTASVMGLLSIGLADNALWLLRMPVAASRYGTDVGVRVTENQRTAFDWIASQRPSLFLSNDIDLSYLVSTYTPVRSWVGHVSNTPSRQERQAELDRYFSTGEHVPFWQTQTLLIAVLQNGPAAAAVNARLEGSGRRPGFVNDSYRIYRLEPGEIASVASQTNAVLESFFSTVKSELGERFDSNGEAKMQLFDCLEVFYNQRRRHSSVGRMSPAVFERKMTQAA